MENSKKSALAGYAFFENLKQSYEKLREGAGDKHRIFAEAFGREIGGIHFIPPYTLVLIGELGEGESFATVCHFSQAIVHFIQRPGQQFVWQGGVEFSASTED